MNNKLYPNAEGFIGEAASAFSLATVGANSADQGISIRQIIVTTIPSKRQIRVTFGASTAGAFLADNCAIALVGGATAPNVSTIPTQLFFAGLPNFSLAASGTITSDWVNFPQFLQGASVAVICDINAVATSGNDRSNSSAGNTLFFKAASASYNLDTVASYSTAATTVNAVVSIEVR